MYIGNDKTNAYHSEVRYTLGLTLEMVVLSSWSYNRGVLSILKSLVKAN